MSKIRSERLLLVGLVLVQALDILIHASTDQLEALRVASNLLIAGWALAGASARLAYGALAGYLLLNGLFLATQGFSNPSTDQPRTALFLLVALTTGLVLAFLRRRR